jgi:tetratricopeptide (TPR) repeat protein
MDTLQQIVSGLNKEELRFFKIYASRVNSKQPRKDLELFDLVRSQGVKFEDEAAAGRLYPDGNKNPYYRLKNRLISDLCKSLMVQHFEEDDLIHAQNLMNLARFFHYRNSFQLSLHYLKKAEKKALKLEQYELLDIIYSEFIRLSQELVRFNPETYIAKRNENDQKLRDLRQIDDILATVKYKLKVTQNFNPKKNPVMDMLQDTVNQLSDSGKLIESPALRFRIYQAVSQILLQQHDYRNLEDYLLETFDAFTTEKLFNRANHQTKLQMLTYLVNSLFKNGKSEESLAYAEQLHASMKEFDSLHYDRYHFFYTNALVFNYSQTDQKKAIDILLELESSDRMQKAPFYVLFVYLNLSVLQYWQQDYRAAIKNLNRLYLHDSFKNADDTLKFGITIAEIQIRMELDDSDFLQYRLDQVRKDHAEELARPENKRANQVLSLIDQIALKGENVRDPAFLKTVEDFRLTSDPESEEAELITYNEWIGRKVK